MESKATKKKWIIIIAICIIVVIVVCVCLYLFNQQNKNDSDNEEVQTTGTEWGDIYLNHIQKSITEDVKIPQNALPQNLVNQSVKEAKSDIKGSFIEVREQEYPVMILKYSTEPTEHNNGNFIEYSYIDNTGKVKTSHIVEKTKLSETSNEKEEIKYLYNIEKDSYDWYFVKIHEEVNNNKSYITTTCQPIYIYINGMKMQDNARENEELFQKAVNESVKYMTENIYTFYNSDNKQKFEDIFIDINDMIEHSDFTFTLDMSMKEIRDFTNKFIKMLYKTNEELTTANIQEKVAKVKEESNKVEKEENTETNKNLEKDKTYGFYYGTYSGTGGDNGEYDGARLTINSNKTYTIKYKNGKTQSDDWYPYGNEIMLEVQGKSEIILEITSDSSFKSGDGGTFTLITYNFNSKEEEKQGIKVENYTIKFGKYKGAGTEAGYTFIIMPNKTYEWKWKNGETTNGTWDNSYGGFSLDGDQWSMHAIADNVLQNLNKDGTYTWYSE